MARQKDLLKREKIISVVTSLIKYWPLTLRQIYYRLVAAGEIENNRTAYQGLSKILTELRHDELVSWDAMEDRTRRTSTKRGFTDSQEYLKIVTSSFLTGYTRCRVQGQEKHVEVMIEKDALSKIFENVVWPYCMRVTTCKGYDSTTKVHKYAERARAAIAQGQTPVVLYFGDFDPSGWDMFNSMQKRLSEKFKVHGIVWKRIALTPEIIEEYQLPKNPDALKRKDPRANKFMELYGDLSVELDALHPEQLENLIEPALSDEIDWDMFNEQQEIEEIEQANVKDLRNRIMALIETEMAA